MCEISVCVQEFHNKNIYKINNDSEVDTCIVVGYLMNFVKNVTFFRLKRLIVYKKPLKITT